jgi:hypothetical protein
MRFRARVKVRVKVRIRVRVRVGVRGKVSVERVRMWVMGQDEGQAGDVARRRIGNKTGKEKLKPVNNT